MARNWIRHCKNWKMGACLYQVSQTEEVSLKELALDTNQDDPIGAMRKKIKRTHKPIVFNQRYTELVGYSKNELMHISDTYSLYTLMISEKKLLDFYRNFSQESSWSGFLRWNRSKYFVEFNSLSFSEEGRRYLFSLYTDITDKIIAHDKLQQFFASQSRTIHDFKNPMAAIVGWARQIRQYPDQLHSGLMHIERSANRLLGLADAGLSMNEVFSDRMEVKPEWTFFQDIEVMLDSLFALTVARKGLRWMCDFPVERRLQIFADELRLTQILQNLLQNSLKFTSKGEIKIHCLIDDAAPSSGIDFVITDTGIGIAKENHQKIFEPYEKLARSTEGEFSYGLGLTTTKELVERMEGNITLASEPGVGTTFTVSFPKMEYRLAPT